MGSLPPDEFQLSRQTTYLLDNFLNEQLQKIAAEATRSTHADNRTTMTVSDIHEATLKVLSNGRRRQTDLAINAARYASGIVQKYLRGRGTDGTLSDADEEEKEDEKVVPAQEPATEAFKEAPKPEKQAGEEPQKQSGEIVPEKLDTVDEKPQEQLEKSVDTEPKEQVDLIPDAAVPQQQVNQILDAEPPKELEEIVGLADELNELIANEPQQLSGATTVEQEESTADEK